MEHDKDFRIITTSFDYHGSEGGIPFDDGVYSTIKRFLIHHREWICSIQIEYDQDGDSIWSSKHGVKHEGSKSEIVFDSPEEYITSIHGYYGDIDEWGIAATVIRSLTLETNKKIYGPFGNEEGTKFKFPTKGVKKIVGFHGRCGWYLDAIGLHVEATQDVLSGSEPVHISLGQFGGEGGRPWKEVFTTLRRIVVNHGQWIDSIQIEYDDNDGNIFWSPKHGGNGGSPSEFRFISKSFH